MALKFRDPVAVKHPKHEGFQVVSRQAAGVMSASGWVEDKSPEAKASVAKATRPREADTTTTSNIAAPKEDSKP